MQHSSQQSLLGIEAPSVEPKRTPAKLADNETVVHIAIPPLEGTYSYVYEGQLEIGRRVTVSLGRRKAHGFVVLPPADFNLEALSFALKKIPRDQPQATGFGADDLPFYQWVADYYHCPLSQVLEVAIPAYESLREIEYFEATASEEDLSQLRGAKQREIFQFLTSQEGSYPGAELRRRFRAASSPLKRLQELQFIKRTATREDPIATYQSEESSWALQSVELNEPQQVALRAIEEKYSSAQFHSFLLHGVTGSGKTEVYIEAISKVLASGKSALILVPEIALTPQLMSRFAARLKTPLALLHSGVPKRIRWYYWEQLQKGEIRVAIGARSAVFAPLKDLGLVIVDEEHDGSFKQSDGLRYNGRDLAVVRALRAKCPVVLGSATPSLETFHNAHSGKYTYLSLQKRHSSGSSVQIELVDLNKKRPWEMASKNVSPELANALGETISNGGQAFILYNRRGFASYLQCESCEEVLTCPHCDVAFTFHRGANQLRCHYCNTMRTPPSVCPSCSTCPPPVKQKPRWRPEEQPDEPESVGKYIERGSGTERVYEELQELFPDVEIDRLDRDTVSNAESTTKILDKVRSGVTQILVGTQMIAKGHDLPNVLCVGIVDCDVGLHMPDFRAAERVFQLLTQASGRAGRGDISGRVLLQTRVPAHPSIQFTLSHDFMGFAEQELAQRELFKYPPFSKLLRVTISSPEESLPMQILGQLRGLLDKFVEEHKVPATLLGPTPAPIVRLRNKWRAHLLVKAEKAAALHMVMTRIRAHVPRKSSFTCTLDIDPQDML